MNFIKSIYLRLIVCFICAVCIYDIYCTVNLSEHLFERELNPVAKILITQEEHTVFPHKTAKPYIIITHINVAKLVLFKVLGLVAALEIFDWLINSKHNKIAQTIIFSIFIIHILLLLYLTLV